MDREWKPAPTCPDCDAMAVTLNVDPVVAQILYNRGITDPDLARGFLDPKLNALDEPETYAGLTDAVSLIAEAIDNSRSIAVYADYDVDGVCGAAILWHVLKLAGADVDVYIPDRLDEGYGVNVDAVNALADRGVELLITTDCGIRDFDAVETARRRGMTIVVTDHHEAGDTLPPADAVVHPSFRNNGSAVDETVNPCGAAVAFKLAWATARALSAGERVDDAYRHRLVELTGLVALATIADVVPLLGENRILAKFGLQQLARSSLVGIQALLETAKLTDSALESYHVAFVLAPRLNAAGRMEDAKLALELLTTTDRTRALELAKGLEKYNRQRQKTEEQITAEALELAEARGQLADDVAALVLAAEGWHKGVIGIVASKIVDRVGKPVVMLTVDDDTAHGSARSVDGYDINRAFDACSEHLVGYGGHAMAAGLRLKLADLEAFTEAFQIHAARHFKATPAERVLKIDASVAPESLNGRLISQLGRLEPFGHGNPRPLLVSGQVELDGEPRIVGKTGKHLSFSVRWDGRPFRCIAFGQAEHYDIVLDARKNLQLAFEPITDEYIGPGAIQLRVKALRPLS